MVEQGQYYFWQKWPHQSSNYSTQCLNYSQGDGKKANGNVLIISKSKSSARVYFLSISSLYILTTKAKMKVILPHEGLPSLRRVKNYTYNPSHMLGAGNFSKVYSGRNQTTGETVAIKVVQLQSLRTAKLEELHRQEMDILMKISHANVLKCYQIFNDERQCFIVTEVCNGGDLDMFVKKEGFLTEEKAQRFIKDIFEGLLYLSEMGIVHRDLKVANIFLNNGKAKIADFGFAVFAKEKFRDLNIGSPLYMSPQGFIECIYGPKTDVWAFGILIFELLHGDTPYSSCKMENDLRYQLSLRFDRGKVRANISNELKQVIFRCLEVDEGKRITIQQLKDTAYFRRLYHMATQYPNQELRLSPHSHSGLLNIDRSLSNEGIKHLGLIENNKSSHQLHRLGKHTEISSPTMNLMVKPITTQRPKATLLEPPRDAIRLGRPISSQKHMVKLNPPQVTRERLKSIDSKKPVQRYIILTTNINFKAAVNLLHYCRGLFRCVQLMISIKQGQSEIKYLTGWLILVLEEMNRKLNQNQVIFQGENGETKAKKLREVRNEYQRKYTNQLKNYISSFINKPSLQDIKLYFFLQYRKLDIAIQTQQVQNQQSSLQLGHLVVLMYDSTRLLKKCQQQANFARFINYKDIQQMLGWTKDKFTMTSYVGFKKRMIINA